MQTFEYTIRSPNGIHARPAGYLVKTASEFSAEIVLCCGEKTASAKKLFALMRLGARQGSIIQVSVQGGDEVEALRAVQKCIEDNF